MLRSQHGSGIIEGTVGLTMIIGGSVIGALLLLNMAFIGYFQNKLGFVSMQAAQYAATDDSTSTVQQDTQNFVSSALSAAGVSPNQLTVSVQPVTIQNRAGQQVTVKNKFPLFGNGSVLPYELELKDQEFATSSAGTSGNSGSSGNGGAGYVAVQLGGFANGAFAYVPCTYTDNWYYTPNPPAGSIPGPGGQINGQPVFQMSINGGGG